MNNIDLRVAESLQTDIGSGRARLDRESMLTLGISPGDVIELKGAKKTPAIAYKLPNEDMGKGIIRIDSIVRKNAGVSMGDRIEVSKIKIQGAKKVVLANVTTDRPMKLGKGLESFIKRGLMKRPLTKGDLIIMHGITLMGGQFPLGVVSTSPTGIVSITAETEVVVKDEAVKEEDISGSVVAYEDIGGLREELRRVREIIELPLKHPELFDRLGIDPPKGVILHGPPGTGKTLIARAVASESGASFHSIQGPEIMNKYYGESERELRSRFEEAEKSSPSIIFIDEIDSIAPKREDAHGEVERRVVAQLLTLMDGMKSRGRVIVIAATNRVDAMDQALRRPGRFDREIEIGVPDKVERREILMVHTRGMPLPEFFDYEYFVNRTHGFVGADLAALAREAAMKALRRYLPEFEDKETIPIEVLEKMEVTDTDFREAFKEMEPSALRELISETPEIGFDRIGGLDEIKDRFEEALIWPLKNPESFIRMGINPPRGLLLYGPPGTGKTLVARAIAKEAQVNFIQVKGPEVISKWFGETEKLVREMFKKAKQAAPSLILIDEIDALATRRSYGSGDSGSDRVVNQLLTSMDDLDVADQVVIIAATNRPEVLDPAMLRTGRFDQLLAVKPPNEAERLAILEIHTAPMPLNGVDLAELAKKTDGYTGADIEGLCREAALIALRADRDADTVTSKHFEKAITRVRASVDAEMTKHYERIAKELEGGLRKKVTKTPMVGYE